MDTHRSPDQGFRPLQGFFACPLAGIAGYVRGSGGFLRDMRGMTIVV